MIDKIWLGKVHQAAIVYNDTRSHRDFQSDEVLKFVEWLHQQYGIAYTKPQPTQKLIDTIHKPWYNSGMKLKNSLQWDQVRRELKAKIQNLPYDASIRHMVKNIDRMVTELSKIEVEARRTKVSYYKDAQLEKINDAIEYIEKIIMIAVLYS